MKVTNQTGLTLSTLTICLVVVLCLITMSAVPGYQIGVSWLEALIIFLCFAFGIYRTRIRVGLFGFALFPMIVFTIIEVFYYKDGAMLWVRTVLLLIAGILFWNSAIRKKINVFKYIYSIGVIFVTFNMIVYFVVKVLGVGLPYLMFSNDWLPPFKNYFFLLYERTNMTSVLVGPLAFYRNAAIFTEPGLYAVTLNILLMINLYSDVRKKKWHFALIMIALFSTLSTTGLMVGALLVLYKMVQNTKRKSNRILKGVVALFATVIITSILLNLKLSNAMASFSWRYYDIIEGFSLFAQKPLIGWGYRNIDVYRNMMVERYYNYRGNSNSIVSTLYQVGLLGIYIYIAPLLAIYRKKIIDKRKSKLFTILVICFLLLIMSQPILDSALGLFVISYLYAYVINGRKYENV